MGANVASPILWLRAETKSNEWRSPLTPSQAAEFVSAGVSVHVEESNTRVFSDDLYQQAGCSLEKSQSWVQAPRKAYILGLKELPEENFPLVHRHIYFAHAYKEQVSAYRILSRFYRGDGKLYDLEFLLDQAGKRVAAFGYWAGFVGAGLSLLAWAKNEQSIRLFLNQKEFLNHISSMLDGVTQPTVLIIGAQGRCGRGAKACFESFGIAPKLWDLEETKSGGPFTEILSFDILANCVLLQGRVSPFLNSDLLRRPRRLSVIADISCDPLSPLNPLPIYNQTTSLKSPVLELGTKYGSRLDLIAIDHLPTVLPLESSEDFSKQLFPHLKGLLLDEKVPYVWKNSENIFVQNILKYRF